MAERAIKISINALGGQGGGVLAGWIVAAGERAGFAPQSTSVPGVAQRTGATVYYVELFPLAAAQAAGKDPVLALMPIAGDVDVVIASELMEAGRAISRGIVTDRTTLIASAHRVYAIDEKSGLGDGRRDDDQIHELADKAAGKLIIADMQTMAEEAGTMISAVLFGALAGSGTLAIAREHFEAVILSGGRGVEASLRGFEAGYKAAREGAQQDEPASVRDMVGVAVSPAAAPLLARLRDFPPEAHYFMREGLKRLVDYQGVSYAHDYIDRLERIRALDEKSGGARRSWVMTSEAAKYLALWMSYEDTIRVADLKTRASRFERFRDDVRASDGQIVHVSEYMHPRVEEICDMLPPGLAKWVLAKKPISAALKAVLGDGRRVSTTKLRGFLTLYAMASLKFTRRYSYRYGLEMERIAQWLKMVEDWACIDYDMAVGIIRMQRLIKGYGETHERGLRNFARITSALEKLRNSAQPAAELDTLITAALADEEGTALEAALGKLGAPAQAA